MNYQIKEQSMERNSETIKININEVAELYIIENYSLELLAKIYKISMAIMSRLLWKFNLPELKEQYYRDKGGVVHEKKYLTDGSNRSVRAEKQEIEVFQARHSASLEDDFFS